MEDFYSNNTFEDFSNHTNTTKGYDDIIPSPISLSITDIIELIIICIGFPLTLLAIHTLRSLVRNDYVPIYIINLLITDVVQLCSLMVWLIQREAGRIRDAFFYVYFFAEMASVGFMVCVALERYLVIAHPLWYRFSRSIKISVLVCVVVWLLPLVYLLPYYFRVNVVIRNGIFAIYHILPLPFFIFFLSGTLKALSEAIRIPVAEKRRIVGILVLVLLIYLFMFMPSVIWSLAIKARFNAMFSDLSFELLYCSPLADMVLYVFIRKGAVDKLLASLSCCKMDSGESTATSL